MIKIGFQFGTTEKVKRVKTSSTLTGRSRCSHFSPSKNSSVSGLKSREGRILEDFLRADSLLYFFSTQVHTFALYETLYDDLNPYFCNAKVINRGYLA